MNSENDSEMPENSLPNGRQPGHENQSGPPDDTEVEAAEGQILQSEQLSESVVKEIKNVAHSELMVPDHVRSAVMNDASEVLKRNSVSQSESWTKFSRRSLYGMSAGLLTAALLFAVVLPRNPEAIDGSASDAVMVERGTAMDVKSQPSLTVEAVGKDIDGNGLVDIRDALAVARSIQSGESVDSVKLARLDQNGDGVVDSNDVDALAMTVVML